MSTLYPDLRLLLAALADCRRELALFATLLVTTALVFATFIRVLEGPEVIPNYLAALWWSLVTMTTVGGVPPQTFLGTLVGMVAIVVGIIAITLPLPFVTSRLTDMRRRLEENRKLEKRNSPVKEVAERSLGKEGILMPGFRGRSLSKKKM